MSLILIPIVKVGNDDVTETILLCSNKVYDFFQNSSGQTVFYYSDTDGQRYKFIQYTTSYTKAQFHAKVREVANEQWINIQFIEWDRTTREGITRINVEHVVKGLNCRVNGNSGYSYLWLERGSNKPHLRVLTTHTIQDISRASSRSASLSPSVPYPITW
jgi:hypothetical protein